MSKKAKNKKVNHLSLKQCEKILSELKTHAGSVYYQHVFKRYNELLLKKEHKG